MATQGERVEEYIGINYPIEISKDEFGFFARIPDLPGCESFGDTLDEAYESIEEAKAAWLEAAVSAGQSIPIPRSEDDYSGKFVVRVGPSIHRDLVRIAANESISLNAFIGAVLARETGRFSAAFSYEGPRVFLSQSSVVDEEDLICTTKSVGEWTVYENVG